MTGLEKEIDKLLNLDYPDYPIDRFLGIGEYEEFEFALCELIGRCDDLLRLVFLVNLKCKNEWARWYIIHKASMPSNEFTTAEVNKIITDLGEIINKEPGKHTGRAFNVKGFDYTTLLNK